MRVVTIFGMAFVATAFITASATIINIPDDYLTIQQGIDASTDGDTVLVQPGTYVENINFNGHNIVLGSLFLMTGDTTYIAGTIIDGDSSGSVVTFESGEDSTAVIKGFTIQNGYAHYGGGIYISESNIRIDYNIITQNSMFGFYEGWVWHRGKGGGMYCSNSNAQIYRNLICNNGNADYNGPGYLGTGGGIYIGYADPTVRKNIISENITTCDGGGISSYYSNPIIMNNTLNANSVYSHGGGIRLYNSNGVVNGNDIYGNSSPTGGGLDLYRSNPSISNNTITNNSCEYGGAIHCQSYSSPIIINNSIVSNFASSLGGGIKLSWQCNAIIINSIIWFNTSPSGSQLFIDRSFPLIDYSNIQDTLWPGEGNIDIDPLFRDPDNGDFHLMDTACGDPEDSPSIDAGHPDILDSLLDCSWGLGTILSDMGAYGGGDSVTVGIDDYEMPLPEHLALLQNYPNPFNASTVIRYSLLEPADVKIEIFDILGRRVRTFLAEKQPAGYHQIIWNAEKRSSGMYFYRIEAGEYSDTKKMVLLK